MTGISVTNDFHTCHWPSDIGFCSTQIASSPNSVPVIIKSVPSLDLGVGGLDVRHPNKANRIHPQEAWTISSSVIFCHVPLRPCLFKSRKASGFHICAQARLCCHLSIGKQLGQWSQPAACGFALLEWGDGQFHLEPQWRGGRIALSRSVLDQKVSNCKVPANSHRQYSPLLDVYVKKQKHTKNPTLKKIPTLKKQNLCTMYIDSAPPNIPPYPVCYGNHFSQGNS